MGFKNKIALILMTALLSSFLAFSEAVFAEGNQICGGSITGVTKAYNSNSGVVSFDAHPDAKGVGGSVDVAIVTGSHSPEGQAPATWADAGCINKEASKVYGYDYEYALKGWAWNTNGGFVSLNCDSGANNAGGSDVSCGGQPEGDIDYGVYISKNKGVKGDQVDGTRELFGYAWNSTFGYIQFHDNDIADAIKYGVKIDVNGKSRGYAWTQAGIYIEMSDLTFNLPDKKLEDKVKEKWCKDKKDSVCIEIDPDPAVLTFNPDVGNGTDPSGLDIDEDSDVKIADGKDGYDLHIYFKDKDGAGIDPGAIKNLDKIKFEWLDTVKTDQIDAGIKVGNQLNENSSPWNSWTKDKPGGVTFKPMGFSNFVAVTGETGHYKTKQKIASYAPTSESKSSLTTSTKPPYLVNNETFIYPPDGVDLPTESNQLILKQVSYPDLVDKDGKVLIPKKVVYPNGGVELPFKFRPAIFVETLYANDLQDTILAYRSVPFIVKRGLKKIGNLDFEEDGNSATFYMTYSDAKSKESCIAYNFIVKDGLEGSTGKEVSSKVEISSKISALLNGTFDLVIDPEISADKEGGKLSCDIAEGANIYSKIVYGVKVEGGGYKNVSYYDNKLPRIGGNSIVNPAAVVHGNIFAQAAGNVQGDQRIQTSGSVNINLVRDAINENLQKYADQKLIAKKTFGDCVITAMDEQSGKGMMGLGSGDACPSGSESYFRFNVGSEHVLYTKKDITLSFSNGRWTGKWVVIADGANVFVDGNLYADDPAKSKMSLIAFRSSTDDDYNKTGNIYIAPTVTNIQGTLVADGTIFSYDGDHAHIDNAPKESGKPPSTGEPVWADYSTMLKTLNTQLLIEGALYSDNTIGGANLDQGTNPKQYLLAGGGEIIKLPAGIKDRMRAQYYDLNYLRMFRLGLELGKDGLPIDQKCGKGWSPDDQVKLAKILGTEGSMEAICSEKKNANGSSCDINKGIQQGAACDGINPLAKYDEESNTTGDLVVPTEGMVLADGLDPKKDFDPIYIYYKAPDKNSFVFSKGGATSISGK